MLKLKSWLGRRDLQNVGFWNVPVKIWLWNVSLSSVWLSKSSGLWKARSDNLQLPFELWLWKFKFKNLIENWIWKISLWKFDVGNSTWNLTFEICLLKLDFGKNWTLVISLFTFDVGPLNWTFDGWLLKIHFWKLTVEMSLWKVDFCLVLHEFLDLWLKMEKAVAKTGNCNDQAKAIDLLLTQTDLI